MKTTFIFTLALCTFALFAFTTPETHRSAVGGAYLTIDGKHGGDITTASIEKNPKLKIHGCAAGSTIYKYTLVVTKGGKTEKMRGTSGELTGKMVEYLTHLSVGDEFTFEDVLARHGKNDDISVRARTFRIVAG